MGFELRTLLMIVTAYDEESAGGPLGLVGILLSLPLLRPPPARLLRHLPLHRKLRVCLLRGVGLRLHPSVPVEIPSLHRSSRSEAVVRRSSRSVTGSEMKSVLRHRSYDFCPWTHVLTAIWGFLRCCNQSQANPPPPSKSGEDLLLSPRCSSAARSVVTTVADPIRAAACTAFGSSNVAATLRSLSLSLSLRVGVSSLPGVVNMSDQHVYCKW